MLWILINNYFIYDKIYYNKLCIILLCFINSKNLFQIKLPIYIIYTVRIYIFNSYVYLQGHFMAKIYILLNIL